MPEIVTENERQVAVAAIKLDEKTVDGLMPIQIEAMKSATVEVNEALNVAGNAWRAAAYSLSTLKRNLKRGNWTAYINSGVLNVSAKAAQDLVSAYDNWLESDKNVSDYVLATFTPRSLAAIANAPVEARNRVLSAAIGSNKTSEAEVRKIIQGSAPKKKPVDTLTDAVHEMTEVVRNTKKTSIEELVKMTEKCEALEQENKSLKARVKELEAELARS